MDDTDRKLLILLGAEPRMHLRELAQKLGISRQAAHHRMQILMKMGVITGITAAISVSYLDAVPVVVFGFSKSASIEKTLDKLAESELSRRAVLAGGGYLYVVGFLRKMSELAGYVEFVKRTAEIPDPTVGIFCLDDGLLPYYSVDGGGERKRSQRELSPLDFRIIALLKDNARRPVVEIADTLGVSAKTVRRHLKSMISDGSLELSMPSDLFLGGDFLVIVHVTIRDGASRVGVGRRLLYDYPFKDAYIRTFGNLPNLLIWVLWTNSIAEIRNATRSVGEGKDVVAVVTNFAYLERFYTNWRDALPLVRENPSSKTKTHHQRSGSKAH